MALHPTIISEAEAFVFDTFKRNLPEGLVYHTFSHSETVAETARRIAEAVQLGEEGIEIVVLAAWLHDLGYTELYHGHEEVSIRIASDFLRSKQYPPEKVALIVGCIEATKVPQNPKNILEEIVADADLASLGKKSFFEQSELLRIEWERALDKKYTDAEWVEQNIDLLSGHTFFTRTARDLFAEGQTNNLRKLYKRRQKVATIDMDDIPTSSAPSSETDADVQPSRDGLYILLHAMAQRQLSAQMFVNQQFVTLTIISTVIIALCTWLAIHFTDQPRPVEVPFFVVIITSVLTILVCRQGLSRRGKYFEDQAASGSVDALHGHVSQIKEKPDVINEIIISDCFEHKQIVDSKRQLMRQAILIQLLGLALGILLSVVVWQP